MVSCNVLQILIISLVLFSFNFLECIFTQSEILLSSGLAQDKCKCIKTRTRPELQKQLKGFKTFKR